MRQAERLGHVRIQLTRGSAEVVEMVAGKGDCLHRRGCHPGAVVSSNQMHPAGGVTETDESLPTPPVIFFRLPGRRDWIED